MDVRIDATGGQDLALAGDDLGAWANDYFHIRLDVRIARLADLRDAAIGDGDIGLHDAPVVDDQCVGDHRIDGTFGLRCLRLPHAVADDLAAAELHLLAVRGEVAFYLDDEVGVGEADAIASGWPEHVGIGSAGNAGHQSSAPMTAARNPCTTRLPRYGTSETSRV